MVTKATTIQISMYEQPFDITAPYTEGHKLTAIEAAVLNRVRAENISNNMRSRVKAVKDGKKDAGTMEDVTKAIKAYDKEYVFNMTATRGSSKAQTPLQKECTRLARARLVAAIKGSEYKTFKAYAEAVGADTAKAKIAEIAEMEEIQKMAKENLAKAEKAPAVEISL